MYLNLDFLKSVLLDDRKHNDRRRYFDYEHFFQVMVVDKSLEYFCLTEILIVQRVPDVQRDSGSVHECDNYQVQMTDFIFITIKFDLPIIFVKI